MGVNSLVRDWRIRSILVAVVLALSLGVDIYADDTKHARSEVKLWSLGAVQQRGPGDDTFRGLRALFVVYSDDEYCGPPVTMFGGVELLARVSR